MSQGIMGGPLFEVGHWIGGSIIKNDKSSDFKYDSELFS